MNKKKFADDNMYKSKEWVSYGFLIIEASSMFANSSNEVHLKTLVRTFIETLSEYFMDRSDKNLQFLGKTKEEVLREGFGFLQDAIDVMLEKEIWKQ